MNRLMLAFCTPAIVMCAPAHAEERSFNVPAGSLKKALDAFVRQSGMQVIYRADEIRTARSPGARGRLSAPAALNALLAGSGFSARFDASGAAAIVPSARSVADGDGSELADRNEILVTGTRIKGAETASPTTSITAEQIRQEGRTDLGMIIRDLPQNFNGGQNPGVLSGAGGTNPANRNIGGGSALNLRGLGPDATLTLLNGKRLSYSGFNNAIDISAIPIAAVERFEIIADGASAIYGSDAVAGVANVTLRRDFDGVTAALRGGTTTRGGGDQYQLSITGGTTWDSGGVLLAYDRGETDPIFARQRNYITGLADPASIGREASHDGILFSGHQKLGSLATFSADALYTHSKSRNLTAFPGRIFDGPAEVRGLTVAPAIDIDLTGGWTGKLLATYGRDKNFYRSIARDSASGAKLSEIAGCYCNTTRVAEAGVEGPLFELPGGTVRIAAGGGYRRNAFRVRPDVGGGSAFGGSTSSRYAYGELNLPLVSPAMEVPGIYRLSMTGALRYEKYRGISGTTTPKIGAVYELTRDLSLKGSWGRSFKAASLRQQLEPGYGFLTLARNLGGSSYPANAVALFVSGPNPYLKPERAETWTATLAVHPETIAGLNIETSYFNVKYTARVIAPVNNIFASFSEPAYAPFITYSPTVDQVNAALAKAGVGYTNNVGGDNYAAVAIVDSSNANATSDHVSGFDVSGSYRFMLGGGETVLRGSGSWLRGRRQLLPGGPTLATAGVIFNPPEFRGRAGITWDKNGFGIAAFFNHLDGVFANYFVVNPARTGSFDTVDANLRYAFPQPTGVLAGLELALSVNNLFDAKPPLYQPSTSGLPNYDSTNYSPIGRALSLTLTKSW